MKSKKAFTLIEVIVVMVVLGVLILMATTNNKSSLKDAQLTQIKADIKSVETGVRSKGIEGIALKNEKVTKSKSEIEKIVKDLDAMVYDKEGNLKTLPDDEFFKTTYAEQSVVGELTGDFIVGKNNKEVYYISKNIDTEMPSLSTYTTNVEAYHQSRWYIYI